MPGQPLPSLTTQTPYGAKRRTPPSAWLLLSIVATSLAACSSAPLRSPPAAATSASPAHTATKSKPATSTQKRGGGYYQDDGPGDTPDDATLAAIPDAQPQPEPLHRFANRPYVVFNRRYEPLGSVGTYRDQGIGSWYGRKFHGQRTSTGEVYDMYAMTAAHPTLPLPSYARVSNPANGRSVVVRVNDRGPFHADRIIDLSYVAAWKLGYIGQGSTLLEVESLAPSGASWPAPGKVPVPGTPAASGASGNVTASQAAGERADPLAEMIQRLEAPPAAEAGLLPQYREMRGVYLQLAAFGNAANAESFKAHLARELNGTPAAVNAPASSASPPLAERLRVQSRAGVYRVQLGPWADQASARQVAEQLRLWFAIEPLVVQQ